MKKGLTVFSKFTDKNGANVRVQESSVVAASRCCWIFVDGEEPGEEDNKGAAHLTKQQAKWVIKALEKFIKS